MKASLVTYDFRKLHKKLGIKIINHGIYQKAAQNSQQSKFDCSKFQGLTFISVKIIKKGVIFC